LAYKGIVQKEKATKREGGALRMKKTLVELPENLHKTLKHYAVEHDRQMKDVVAEALRRYLGFKEGGESSKK